MLSDKPTDRMWTNRPPNARAHARAQANDGKMVDILDELGIPSRLIDGLSISLELADVPDFPLNLVRLIRANTDVRRWATDLRPVELRFMHDFFEAFVVPLFGLDLVTFANARTEIDALIVEAARLAGVKRIVMELPNLYVRGWLLQRAAWSDGAGGCRGTPTQQHQCYRCLSHRATTVAVAAAVVAVVALSAVRCALSAVWCAVIRMYARVLPSFSLSLFDQVPSAALPRGRPGSTLALREKPPQRARRDHAVLRYQPRHPHRVIPAALQLRRTTNTPQRHRHHRRGRRRINNNNRCCGSRTSSRSRGSSSTAHRLPQPPLAKRLPCQA